MKCRTESQKIEAIVALRQAWNKLNDAAADLGAAESFLSSADNEIEYLFDENDRVEVQLFIHNMMGEARLLERKLWDMANEVELTEGDIWVLNSEEKNREEEFNDS